MRPILPAPACLGVPYGPAGQLSQLRLRPISRSQSHRPLGSQHGWHALRARSVEITSRWMGTFLPGGEPDLIRGLLESGSRSRLTAGLILEAIELWNRSLRAEDEFGEVVEIL